MKKKLLLVIAVGIYLMLLTGCGGKLESSVDIANDMSGSRVETYTISKEDFNEYVNGDIATVDATVKQNCPAGYSYSLLEGEDAYVATFSLSFSSLEDYKTKVQAIAPTQFESEAPEVTCTVCDSVFSTGIAYSENFEGKDLMDWLPTLLVNSGYVSSSDKGYIFNEDSQCLYYAGQKYESSGYGGISVSQMSYIPIEEIKIYTRPTINNQYDRIIDLTITDANLKSKEEEIKAFLDESVPSDAKSEWTNDMGMNTFTVTMEDMSLTGLETAMKTYCHSEESKVTKIEANESLEYKALFGEDASFEEYLDMSKYGCNEEGEVLIQYYTDNVNSCGSLYYKEQEGEYSGYIDSSNYGGEEDREGYQINRLGEISTCYLCFDYYTFYPFSNIDINVKVNNGKSLEREMIFNFAPSVKAEEVSSIATKIDEYVQASEEKLDIKTTAEDTVITMVLKGTPTEMEEQMAYLAGEGNGSKFSYAQEKKWISFKNACSYTEKFNFTGLVCNVFYGELNSGAVPVKYTIKMKGTNPNRKAEVVNEEDKTQLVYADGVYSMETTANASISTGLTTYRANGTGILYVLLLLASIAMFAVAIIVFVIGIVKNKSKKKAEQQPAQQPMQQMQQPEPPMMGQPMQQQPYQQPMQQQSYQQPVQQQSYQQPVEQQPIPQPVEQQPIPQPVEQQPIPQPVEQQPIPQPVEQQPIPQPVEQQPIPQPIEQPTENNQ